MAEVPSTLKYTKTHEWVQVAGDVATIGITDFAQHELSDVVYVELGTAGRTVKQGDAIGTIEAVKAVSELYTPVSGEVTAVNTDLKTAADLVNKDPYGKGWMVKVKLANPAELGALIGSNEYTKLTAQAAH